MSKRMKQCRGDLQLLGQCRPSTRKLILKHCDDKLIQAISDAVYTTLARKIPLSPQQVNRLKKDQTILRQIAAKNRTSKQKRRALATQKGGNIIGFLFNALKSLF